jgi:hypothetical protein
MYLSLEEVVVRVGRKSIMLIVGYPQGILDQQLQTCYKHFSRPFFGPRSDFLSLATLCRQRWL